MEWKNQLARTPYLVLFVVLISIGVGTASALITITLAGNVIITDDLTVDTDTLFVDSSQNRIGIGTTSPASALHITAGGADFSPNENGIQLTGSDIGGNAGIELTTDGGIPFIDFKNDTGPGDYDARIILHGDDALAIRGTNVGIDVSYPEEKLDVAGNVRIDGNYIYSTNQTRTLIIPYSSFVPNYRSELEYGSIGFFNFNSTSQNSPAIAIAPVVGIPDGAIIKEFGCTYKDADENTNFLVECTFVEISDWGAYFPKIVVSNTTSGVDSSVVFLNATLGIPQTFDSSKGNFVQYSVDPTSSDCGYSLCTFYGMRIIYEVSKVD